MWKYILAAVGTVCAVLAFVFVVFGVTPSLNWLEGPAIQSLSTSPGKFGGQAALKDYEILRQGALLEAGATVYLVKKPDRLSGDSVVSLVRCVAEDCTIQRVLQKKGIEEAAASNRFDQFVFFAGADRQLYYVNLADNIVSRGRPDAQCTPRGGEPPAAHLKSVANRSVYLTLTGEDCLSVKFNGQELPLTAVEVKQPTTDQIKLNFAQNGSLSGVELESGADAQGRSLK